MAPHARWIATFIAAAGLCLSSMTAGAVALGSGGRGQVLLFPYYTVNANNNTLVSIVNSSGQAKALRVRFAEGQNGRDALSLDVYLGSRDVWTAAIGPNPDNSGGAMLVTHDASCTVPAIPASGIAFSSVAFSGDNADAGGASLARTREGFIEVIEMGTLLNAYPLLQSCAMVVAAWQPAGMWTQDAASGLANPTGGLYGTGYVVNVGQGTIFAYAATALQDFRTDPHDQPRGSSATLVLHTAPGAAHPNLADAVSDPAQDAVRAEVATDDGFLTANYPATRAIDAVSAVLMASALSNDYSMAAAEGSSTSVVFAYPTRRFYTDPAWAGDAALAPFTHLFSGVEHNTETEYAPLLAYSRSGFVDRPPCGTSGCPLSMQMPGTSVELLALGDGANQLLGSGLVGFAGLEFNIFQQDPVTGQLVLQTPQEGWILVDFDGSLSAFLNDDAVGPMPSRFMRPSLEDRIFAGLPVIGFSAQNLVDANAQPGVLANYSSAVAHRVRTNCYVPAAVSLAPAPCR